MHFTNPYLTDQLNRWLANKSSEKQEDKETAELVDFLYQQFTAMASNILAGRRPRQLDTQVLVQEDLTAEHSL